MCERTQLISSLYLAEVELSAVSQLLQNRGTTTFHGLNHIHTINNMYVHWSEDIDRENLLLSKHETILLNAKMVKPQK